MLETGSLPNDWSALLKEAKAETNRLKEAINMMVD
jgi:hypothetical protein